VQATKQEEICGCPHWLFPLSLYFFYDMADIFRLLSNIYYILSFFQADCNTITQSHVSLSNFFENAFVSYGNPAFLRSCWNGSVPVKKCRQVARMLATKAVRAIYSIGLRGKTFFGINRMRPLRQ
jgi:hypothetical protein